MTDPTEPGAEENIEVPWEMNRNTDSYGETPLVKWRRSSWKHEGEDIFQVEFTERVEPYRSFKYKGEEREVEAAYEQMLRDPSLLFETDEKEQA